MHADNQHILITGTTSGIGLGMMRHFDRAGWTVTAVNRRKDPEFEKLFPKVRFEHFDVRDLESVRRYFKAAAAEGRLPSVYFLSAGINKVDNVGKVDIDIFKEVMDINLTGVMNFVSEAVPLRDGKKTLFVGASSTTNIFANPNCLAYYVSKWAVHKTFRMMDRTYRSRGLRFKTLVLGPVATNIFVSGKLASRLQSAVRDFITVSVDETVPKIARFMDSDCGTLYHTKTACALFLALRAVSAVFPGFYKGSAPGAPDADPKS